MSESKDIQQEENKEEVTNYVITPPNGGWGWLVVLSAFYCNVVVDGIQLTFGIFLQPISKYFKAEYFQVALAGSLMFGVHLLMGPVCAGFNNVFGLRPVTITGSLICCFGVGISYFSTCYWTLYISFGILGGIGLGLIYMNSLVITSLYFTSLLPVAMAIVVCGTGVGTMAFAVLGTFLLNKTTWQNSFLMQAAFAGSVSIAAIVFKPLKPIKLKISTSSSLSKITHGKKQELGESSEERDTVLYVKKRVPPRLARSSKGSMQSVAWNLAENVVAKDLQVQRKKQCECSNCWKRKRKKMSQAIELKHVTVLHDLPKETFIEKQSSGLSLSIGEMDADGQYNGGSMVSVFTRIYQEEPEPNKRNAWKIIKKTAAIMTDCRLMRSLSFVVFTLSGAINISSTLVVFIYEKDRIQDLGFSENSVVYFYLLLGGANVFWRLSLGGFAKIPKIDFKVLTICGIVIGGTATACSGYYSNMYFQFTFCILFGLAMASFAVSRMVFLVELVGIDKITTATGINLLFMGVFSIACPPLYGFIMGATKDFSLLFLLVGLSIIVSGLMLIKLKKVQIK